MKPRSENAAAGGFFGLITLWFAVEYLRPQDYAEFIGVLRPGLVLLMLLFAVWFVRGDKTALKDNLVVNYLVFIALGVVSLLFVRNHYWAFQNNLNLISYLFGGVLPFIAFMNRPDLLRRFFAIWVFIHAVVALGALVRGGTGSGSFLGDENDLALTLAMALPFAYFLAMHGQRTVLMKVLFVSAGLLMIAAIVATRSRGGFLGMMMAAFAIILFSRNRVRNLIGVTVVAGLAAFVLTQAHLTDPLADDPNDDREFRQRHAQSYMDEMSSIQDATDSTRLSRFYFWGRAWQMFKDNPVLGVGTSNFGWRIEEYENNDPTFSGDRRMSGGRVAHSLYLTVLAEYGAAGAVIFTVLCVGVWNRLRRSRQRLARAEGEDANTVVTLSRACSASLLAYLVSGAFLTVLYYPNFWYLLGFAITLERSAVRLVPDAVRRKRFGRAGSNPAPSEA